MNAVGIRHIGFVPGDQRVWYRDLPDVEGQIQRLQIPDEEEIWNWGYCRRSPMDYEAHVANGFASLVAHLAAERIDVDAVLCCAPNHNSTERFVAALASGVLPKISFGADRLQLVESGECVNVLQALGDAVALLHSGHRHVVIVASEKVEEERRFRKYSMFSDFCLALVVTSHVEQCPYEILAVRIDADPNPGEDTGRILERRLEKECVSSLLSGRGLAPRDVSKFFYLNLFEPIAEMKGKQIGFVSSQLYTAATKEFGHCYGADPFVNLSSYLTSGGLGRTHILCASGRGSVGVSLIARRV